MFFFFHLQELYNGMIVYRVVAVDFDTGRNGVVEYMFVHEGQETVVTPEFQINPITGVITARIIYDREKLDRYVVSFIIIGPIRQIFLT